MVWIKGITLSLILLCSSASMANAWGIGVHLEVGSWLLQTSHVLPASLAALLHRYRDDFLYGCISADITLGKKYTHYLEHCHGWRIGDQIRAAADTPSREAFAWGYLAHLAADTVAHGYFVPVKLICTFNTTLLKHAYWEVRMEAAVDPSTWSLAHQVASKSYRDNDALLQQILSDTLFSFGTNKRLFNSLMLLNRLKQWQRAIQTLEKRSRWRISTQERDQYIELICDATASVLSDPVASPFRKADPTGERAIHIATTLRSNLKTLWQEGKLSPDKADHYLAEMKEVFRCGLTQPETLLGLSLEQENAYPLAGNKATTRSRI